MQLKIMHVCKYWTESHLHSKRSSFTQRVISVLSFFPPMDSVIIVTRIAQSSTRVLPCGIHMWLLIYLAMEESFHFQIEFKFKLFCGRAQRYILALPAIHLFYEFLVENMCVSWGGRLNKGVFLTFKPMKLLK